ncbi:MAG TPA: hypothetical protein VL126_03775, partial [Bacteroidota bacterium]|nr:hypothetical protein [Bacteroidota bacterium]
LLFAILIFPGCEHYYSPDDITGPDQISNPPPDYVPPPGPPQCAIVSFSVDGAILVTSRGGNINIALTVSNATNAEWALGVRADITARTGDRVLGQASIPFDVLRTGETSSQYIWLAVSDFPAEVDCTLSWSDASGNTYVIQAVADYSVFLKRKAA